MTIDIKNQLRIYEEVLEILGKISRFYLYFKAITMKGDTIKNKYSVNLH